MELDRSDDIEVRTDGLIIPDDVELVLVVVVVLVTLVVSVVIDAVVTQ